MPGRLMRISAVNVNHFKCLNAFFCLNVLYLAENINIRISTFSASKSGIISNLVSSSVELF